MNDVEDAFPAGKSGQARGEFPVAVEPVLVGLLNIGGRRALEGEVNHQRPGNDGVTGNETPEARIEAVVAIVAQHEVLAGRNDELTVAGEVLQLAPPLGVDV